MLAGRLAPLLRGAGACRGSSARPKALASDLQALFLRLAGGAAAPAVRPRQPLPLVPSLFPVPVHCAYDVEQIEEVVERLWPHHAASPGAAPLVFVGCDTEYKPNRTRGAPRRRTALVQLASGTGAGGECLLAAVHPLPQLPGALRSVLTSARCVKVGVGVADDLHRLSLDFALPPVGTAGRGSFLDVGVVASLYGHERTGLANLSAFFGLVVAKPKSVQMSNWEAAPLSGAQVSYAALDAQLSLWLLEQLHARYAAPAGDVCLAAWAEHFVGARTVADVAARMRAQRAGPPAVSPAVASAVREYEARRAAAAAVRTATRELRVVDEGAPPDARAHEDRPSRPFS